MLTAMATWVLFLSVTMVTHNNFVASSNSTQESEIFGELPKGNYNASNSDEINKGSLDHLFTMAQGFVDVVFKPFSDLSGVVAATLSNGDGLTYLQNNWQTVASFEAGYLACFVFGVLFIIFVPIVGLIMCCCRTCCNNCGGKMQQSSKRSKSCWRQCLCVSMLILTVFMAVPTVFVFLTNEWVTDVIEAGPSKTVALLSDTEEYLTLVPTQITYMTDQYQTVDENIRPLVSDFGPTIGVPLQKEVEILAEPSMAAMNGTIDVVNSVNMAINDVNSSLDALQVGMATLNNSLTRVRTDIQATANPAACGGDIYCDAVRESAKNLQLGFDPADFDSLKTDLQSVSESLNDFDVEEMYTNVTKEINSIPQKTTDQTAQASADAIQALDDAANTISDLDSNIPTDQFDRISNQVDDIKSSITNAFDVYNDNFDKYRYIAGIILGCILAVIVFFYWIGLLLGVCGAERKVSPSERGAASNCGGIMLMIGVGLSFIFSWLLMILVLITFTIGGHGERYGCQGLEGPNYEALQVIDNNTTLLNLESTFKLPSGVSLGLTDIIKSCEQDESAYQTFKLEYMFNMTAIVQNMTKETTSISEKVDTAVDEIDLSTIDVYSKQNQEDLLGLMDTGLDGINYTDYLSKLSSGLTKIDLTEYAIFLNNSADNFTTSSALAIADDIRALSAEVLKIQAEDVVPLQGDYDTLNSSINTLIRESLEINITIIVLDDALANFNYSIQTNGKTIIGESATAISNQVVENITIYTRWVDDQIKNTVGACKPVYDTYTGVISLFCDYLIDTINGLWFSLGWCVFFLIPSAIVAMKLMKFFSRMDFDEEFEDTWNDMEMRDFGSPGTGNKDPE